MSGKYNYISRIKRKRLLKIAVCILLPAALAVGAVYASGFQTKANRDRAGLLALWKAGDYNEVLRLSSVFLEAEPMDFFFLTMRGYSAFQIAFAQMNKSDTVRYIDECIFSLRKAIQAPEGSRDSRVFYVLGKAYYFKGPEYAELCVKYLEQAMSASNTSGDIYEYLGLAYAELKEWQKSVEAFEQALTRDENSENADSAPLLLAIARSYIALSSFDAAETYLKRCLETAKNIDSLVSAHLLLGGIFRERAEYKEAEKQFLAALSEAGETAAARYELGELYLAQGNSALARSEWRKANRLDPSFAPAIARLN